MDTFKNKNTAMLKKRISFATLVAASIAGLIVAPPQTRAAIIISQYYEGTATNKWIELYNTDLGASADLAAVAIGHWNNANAEGYKTGAAPSFTFTLSGTIAPGGYFLLGNTASTLPSYATPNLSSTALNSVINFNGNDSIALYPVGTFTTAGIIDAVGFTNTGNEGVDKSFVRIDTASPGYTTAAGSNASTLTTVWQLKTLTDVANATAGTPERLESAPVPEPSTALSLMGGLGMLLGLRRMRGSRSSR